jgi:hypothetical protein
MHGVDGMGCMALMAWDAWRWPVVYSKMWMAHPSLWTSMLPYVTRMF